MAPAASSGVPMRLSGIIISAAAAATGLAARDAQLHLQPSLPFESQLLHPYASLQLASMRRRQPTQAPRTARTSACPAPRAVSVEGAGVRAFWPPTERMGAEPKTLNP